MFGDCLFRKRNCWVYECRRNAIAGSMKADETQLLGLWKPTKSNCWVYECRRKAIAGSMKADEKRLLGLWKPTKRNASDFYTVKEFSKSFTKYKWYHFSNNIILTFFFARSLHLNCTWVKTLHSRLIRINLGRVTTTKGHWAKPRDAM